jgi:hypothetical protein
MMKRWMEIFGGFLILVGVMSLVDAIWHIQLGNYLWPLLLVALGVWLLVKPAHAPWWTWFGGRNDYQFNSGWTHTGNNHEQNIFAGDTLLDLSQEIIPGEGANYRFTGFAGEIRILVPDGIGVSVRASYFAGHVNMFGEDMSGVMAPVEDETPGFSQAEKKVFVEVNYFAGEVLVIRKG